MIYTNFPRFVVLLSLLFIGVTLTAQTLKESVILYNSQPVRALIDDKGNIVRIISAEPNYLTEKELEVPEYDKPNRVTTSIETVQETQLVQKKDVEPVVTLKGTSVLHFDRDMAVLSTRVRSELDEIILFLKSNPAIDIVAMTLSEYDNDLVNKNRQSSVKAYLKLKGIQ